MEYSRVGKRTKLETSNATAGKNGSVCQELRREEKPWSKTWSTFTKGEEDLADIANSLSPLPQEWQGSRSEKRCTYRK